MSTITSTTERLQQKLANLTANNEYSNKSAEYAFTSFPLDALLVLFNKAHYECMIDYMEGFKLLNAWLSPILSPKNYHCDITCKYPMLGSYETQRIARILGVKESILIESMISILSHEGDLL